MSYRNAGVPEFGAIEREQASKWSRLPASVREEANFRRRLRHLRERGCIITPRILRSILGEPECEICGHKFASVSELHVDHDHETGLPRGALCARCNRYVDGLRWYVKHHRKARVYVGFYD